MGWGDKLCPMIAEISNFATVPLSMAIATKVWNYFLCGNVTEISVDSLSEKWYYRFTISLRVGE